MPATDDMKTMESNDPPTAGPASPSSEESNGEMSDAQSEGQKKPVDSLPLRPVEPDSSTQIPLPATATSTQVYSNEAQVYHARHASLIEDHNNERYHQCEQGCLALLLEPRVPHYTRIQVLQLLATIVAPLRAEEYLSEAQQMLDSMDGTQVRVQLLRDDNRRMLADLETWRANNGRDGDLEDTLEDQSEGSSSEDQEPAAS